MRARHELEIALFGASDYLCAAAPGCGRAHLAAGSYMADLLGSTERAADFAADHTVIPAGRITLKRGAQA